MDLSAIPSIYPPPRMSVTTRIIDMFSRESGKKKTTGKGATPKVYLVYLLRSFYLLLLAVLGLQTTDPIATTDGLCAHVATGGRVCCRSMWSLICKQVGVSKLGHPGKKYANKLGFVMVHFWVRKVEMNRVTLDISHNFDGVTENFQFNDSSLVDVRWFACSLLYVLAKLRPPCSKLQKRWLKLAFAPGTDWSIIWEICRTTFVSLLLFGVHVACGLWARWWTSLSCRWYPSAGVTTLAAWYVTMRIPIVYYSISFGFNGDMSFTPSTQTFLRAHFYCNIIL